MTAQPRSKPGEGNELLVTTMELMRKKKIGLFRWQKGISLIETLAVIAILSAIGVAYMSALNGAQRNIGWVSEDIEAENLARSQLDAILAVPYADSYSLVSNIPQQYEIAINIDVIDTPTCEVDGNCNTLQLITVTVSRPREGEDRPVTAVSVYKAKQ